MRVTKDIYCSQWASYQIRKIAGCACAGNAGNVFPRHRFQKKPLVNDPDMHHGTCVTHVPCCMSGSLTCCDGENVPGIPGACAPAILCIWQEAHGKWTTSSHIPCTFFFCVLFRLITQMKLIQAASMTLLGWNWFWERWGSDHLYETKQSI